MKYALIEAFRLMDDTNTLRKHSLHLHSSLHESRDVLHCLPAVSIIKYGNAIVAP